MLAHVNFLVSVIPSEFAARDRPEASTTNVDTPEAILPMLFPVYTELRQEPFSDVFLLQTPGESRPQTKWNLFQLLGFPTGSDTAPTGEAPPGSTNSANFDLPSPDPNNEMGAYTLSESPYGTFDQGGNRGWIRLTRQALAPKQQ